MRIAVASLLAACLVCGVAAGANGRVDSKDWLTFNSVDLGGHKRALSSHDVVPETGSLSSPGFQKFAYAPYVANGLKSNELWVANVHGPGERLVARMPGWIVSIAWLQTDRVIAVSVLSPPQAPSADGIWLVPTNGSPPRRLTDFAGPLASSPDGRRLAYMRLISGTWHIGVLDGETGAITELGRGQNPAWSLRGLQLVYEKSLDCICLPEIWTTSVATSRSRKVARGLSPTWSPNGRWVAFRRATREGRNSLWLVSSRGGRPRMLTGRAGSNVWSRRGRWIAFTRRVANARSCRTSLNVVSVRGGPIRRLAVETRVIGSEAWTLSGRGRLVYSATRCFS